jgi:tetratricopeptide (TPR) repeat protein
MTPKSVLILAAAASLALPAAANASAFVLGGALASGCSRAAVGGLADDRSLETCSLALETELLSGRELAGTYVNRGVIELRRKQYELARADFDRAVKVAPDMGEAFVNRGAAYIAQRQYAAGRDEIDKGLRLGSDEPEKAYYNRALANEGLDDMKAAYFDYLKAAELAPDWDAPKKELTRFTVSQP